MAGGDRKSADAVLVLHLAAGKSVQAAARLAGVSESTAFRRLRDEEFRQRVTHARAEMVERALGHLAKGSTEAAVTLRKLLRSKDEKVRLGAARAILDLGSKVRNDVELAERLAALEARQAAQEGQHR